MRSATFIRLSASASILGGLLFAAKTWYDRNDGPPWPTDITDTLIFVIPLLWLVGLVGVYMCWNERSGWIARLGFAIAFMGVVVSAAVPIVMSIFDNDDLWFVLPLGMLILFIGLIIVGIAMISAKVLPGWSAALPLVIGALGMIMFFANPDDPGVSVQMAARLRPARMISSLLLGISWVALGYSLWPAPQVVPAKGEAVGTVLSR